MSLVADNIKIYSYDYDILKKATVNSFEDTRSFDAAQITEWIFVYMAYSHRYDKISVFIKFDESEEYLTLPAKHFYSNYHAIKMGQDNWLDLFNGQMKKFTVSFCDGAYRIDNFENLYEDDLVASVGWGPKTPTDCNYPCDTCEPGA